MLGKGQVCGAGAEQSLFPGLGFAGLLIIGMSLKKKN